LRISQGEARLLAQRLGARPSDIALLVRTNVEGQELVSFLLDHKSSPAAKPQCQYDVVSSESLRIDSASAVNLLAAALTYLLNPEDAIARAQLAYEHARQQGSEKSMAEVFAVSNPVVFENNLPAAFTERKISLRKLSLFELTETLIEIFELGKIPGELPYLLAFQDLVLDFANRERNDLRAFLDWWENNKQKKSIVAPMGAEAMQLFTRDDDERTQQINRIFVQNDCPTVRIAKDDRLFRLSANIQASQISIP